MLNSGCKRRKGLVGTSQHFLKFLAVFLGLFPTMGLRTLADESALERSLPISTWDSCSGAIAYRRRICSLDGGGYRRTASALPGFSESVLVLLKWGKNLEGDCTATVQFPRDFQSDCAKLFF